jgi:hypothetical protein
MAQHWCNPPSKEPYNLTEWGLVKLACQIKDATQIEGVWEQGAEDLRGMKCHETRENCIMRNSIIFTVLKILGTSNRGG